MSTSVVLAATPPQVTSVDIPQGVPSVVLTTEEHIQQLIKEYATLYGLNYPHFRAVLRCESGFNPNAVGDGGSSYGIAQIHLPSHPDITKEQALDPDWAIRWSAQMWANGGAYHWTCWKMLYG